MRSSWVQLRWVLASSTLVMGLLGVALAEAPGAAAAGQAATSVSISAPGEVALGQKFFVATRLTSGGVGVTSRRLALFMDGVLLRTSGVDQAGAASIPVESSEVSVAHTAILTVRFTGSPTLAASAASTAVVIRPAHLTISTIPSVDGISIKFGAQTASTVKGQVVFAVDKLGNYNLVPDFGAAAEAAMRADFVRWSDNIFTAARVVDVTGDLALQLGVHIAYRGSFTFSDASGAPIDPATIQSVTLTSTSGSQLTLTSFQNVWLEAGTAVRRGDVLAESTREWRVLEVMISGTNAVNRGQQHVVPAPDAKWNVGLLLYRLTVQAQDALLGSSLGGTLDLAFPDGTSSASKLQPGTPLEFSRLPRGSYVLRLSTAGMGAPTPVALSRDQTVVIRVITFVDMALVGGVLLLIAAALVFLGRGTQIAVVVRRTWARVGQLGREGPAYAIALPGRTADAWRRRGPIVAGSWHHLRAAISRERRGIAGQSSFLASWMADDARRTWSSFPERSAGAARGTIGAVGAVIDRGERWWRWMRRRLDTFTPSSQQPASMPRRGPAGAATDGPSTSPSPPRLAQTISGTFEHSVPGTVGRLVGSRRLLEGEGPLPSCPNCRRRVPLQATFCASCGTRIPPSV